MSRLGKTLADYMALAISPALIMAMVGSLVFFLLGIFYQGNHESRIRFILALFVFAAVLIGRISIEEGKERASLFAVALAIAMFLAIQKFAGGNPLLSCGLVALVWWCSHKLVWDCTLIDESEDASGEGLLLTAGLEDRAPAPPRGKGGQAPSAGTARRVPRSNEAGLSFSGQEEAQSESEKPALAENALAAWWQRRRERRKRPHAPGVWVVYFSLAALPLFGLGQLAIPADDVEQRRHAFLLLVVYVASGLGLLVTTSFLGLRRYLRQRGVPMPPSMAGVWIAAGALLIVALMALAMLIPRPNAEYAISEMPFSMTSPEQESSRYSPGGDGADKNRPQSRSAVVRKSGPSEPGSTGRRGKPPGGQSGSQGRSIQPESKPESSRNQPGASRGEGSRSGRRPSQNQSDGGQSPRRGDPSSQQSESRSVEPSSARPQRPGDPSPRDQSQAQQAAGQQQSRPTEREEGLQDQPSDRQRQSRPESSGRRESRQAPDPRERQAPSGSASQGSREAQSPHAEEEPLSAANPPSSGLPLSIEISGGWFSAVFKGLLYLIGAVVIGYWLWKSRAQFWAALAGLGEGWLAFWRSLFGRKRQGGEIVAKEEFPRGTSHRPFADFPNPFTTGMAARLSPEALVKYSFEAFEAWSRERGIPRQPDETPYELARMVGARVQSLAADSRRMVDLYCRVAYAGERPTEAGVEMLERFWRRLSQE